VKRRLITFKQEMVINTMRKKFIRKLVMWTLLFAFFMASSEVLSQSDLSNPTDLIARARDAYNDRHFEESARIYGEYINDYPNGPDRDEAGFFRANSLFWLRELRSADLEFSKEETKNKRYADQVLYYRGEIASLERDYNTALVFFDRLLSEYPGSMMSKKAVEARAGLHFKWADRYLQEGAYSLALQHYLQAREATPEIRPYVQYKLGLCHYKLSEFDKAKKVWGDLSMEEDQLSEQPAILASYRMGRLLEDEMRYADAEISFLEITDSYPNHFIAPLAKEGLARVQARSGKTEPAITYWKEEGRGKDLILLSRSFNEAINHYMHKEYKDAERKLLEISAKSDDSELNWKTSLWLARTYMKIGDINKALAKWKEVGNNREFAGPYILIEAAREIQKHDPFSANKFADQSLRDIPEIYREEAMAILAKTFVATFDNKALKSLNNYLSAYPEGKWSSEIAFERAEILFIKGDIKGAKNDYKYTLSSNGHPQLKLESANKLADIYVMQKRFDSAADILKKSVAISEEVPSYKDVLIKKENLLHYARGNYEKGLDYFENACVSTKTVEIENTPNEVSEGSTASPDPQEGNSVEADTAAGDTSSVNIEKKKTSTVTVYSCSLENLFSLFWGYYRLGKTEEANDVLSEIIRADDGSTDLATLWKGILLIENNKRLEAIEILGSANASGPYLSGLMGIFLSNAQKDEGFSDQAIVTLKEVMKRKPDAGFYTKGTILKLSLDSGDYEAYLESLPSPDTIDRDKLSEEGLVSEIRELYEKGAKQSELERINDILQVEATRETMAEEGSLLVAKSGLYTTERAQSIAMMNSILTGHPGTKFAQEIKFYRGEDAFIRKDYKGAISWLKHVAVIDLSDELSFRLLYLQGQSYKMIRELENMRIPFLSIVKEYDEEDGTATEWLDIGVGLTLSREFSAAGTALEVVKSKTDDKKLLAETAYWTGLVYEGTGDLDNAYETFMSVLKKYSGQGMWVSTALYEAAGVKTKQADYDRALELYKQVLNMSKGDKKTSAKVKSKISEVKKLKRMNKKFLNP
jgi:tetratricopeptide (TPR) repeat protein